LTEPQESTEEVQEKITSGNIIKLSWTGRLENSDKIVDQADNTVIVVGKSNVIAGIDEILLEMRPGEPKTVNIPPERGYGKRDPSQMQITSIRKFKKQQINPQPGMQLMIQNRRATIRNVRGGRVTVDFNHPLAGKKLVYEVIVNAILHNPSDIIYAFIKKHLPDVSPEEFSINIDDDNVTIQLPRDEKLLFKKEIQFFKAFIASEITTYLDDISTVQFLETYPVGIQDSEQPLE